MAQSDLNFNSPIDEHTDWGGDESTNWLPVAGQRVQEYIKNSLNLEKTNRQNKDTELQGKITDLEKTVWPISVQLTIPNTLLEYTGAAQVVNCTAQVKRKGGNLATTSISSFTAKLNGAAIGGVTSNNSGLYTFNPSVKDLGSYPVAVTVTSDGMTASASGTIRLERKMWWGFSDAEAVGAVVMSSLGNSELTTTIAKTRAATNSGSTSRYLWICIPTTVGTLTSLKSGGFTVPFSLIGDANGYHYYRSSSKFNGGATENLAMNQ